MNKTGIIGAMDIEVEQLKKDMIVGREVKKAGMNFCEGVSARLTRRSVRRF